jgi:steroid 5-alpha reductase family enzyme
MDRNALIFSVAAVLSGVLLLATDRGFAGGLAVSVLAFSLLWGVSLVLRNAGIVDIFWGPGFVLLGAFYALSVPGGPETRGMVILALVAVWALRLSLHIGLRNAGAEEDFRYQKWREEAGRNFWWVSYLKVFLLQAVVLWIVSSPLLLVHRVGSRPIGIIGGLGLVLWCSGFFYEAVADWQLRQFKRDPGNAGRVLRSGLWSLSRHPNYFGEAVLWWGIALVTLPVAGGLALIGPLMTTYLLLKISGVALLDSAMVERRPDYADYIASTPAFVPLPRRFRTR